jgi:hypothetical protein
VPWVVPELRVGTLNLANKRPFYMFASCILYIAEYNM